MDLKYKSQWIRCTALEPGEQVPALLGGDRKGGKDWEVPAVGAGGTGALGLGVQQAEVLSASCVFE